MSEGKKRVSAREMMNSTAQTLKAKLNRECQNNEQEVILISPTK